jgi:multicomponent Na+:H+ antiporter subunit E
VGGILVRAAFFLGFWLLLSAPDVGVLLQEPNSVGGAGGVVLASEIAVAILASATATSVSLWLWPVGSGRPRLGVLLVLIGRFLVQMVRSGVDVARRAFDPRLPIQPGFVTFRSRLESPQQRAVLGALSSAQPGSIAAGVTPDGDLIYHCLDVRVALEPELRRDESLLARLCGKEGL